MSRALRRVCPRGSARSSRAAARGLRRRGGTFTIIVLVSSALLLSVGGAFVDSSRALGTLTGQRERQEVAKQALAGATEWACAACTGWPATKTEDRATLRLSRATVELTLRRRGEEVRIDATATVKPDVHLSGKGTLVRREQRFVVERFDY